MQLVGCHGEPTQMPTAERRTVSNRVSLGPATRGVWHVLTLAAESFTGAKCQHAYPNRSGSPSRACK